MNAYIERITRNAVRRGIREAVVAGDGRWIALGAAAWLIRFLRKPSKSEVVVERLRVGESITVTNLGPQKGRGARRARKQVTKVSALGSGEGGSARP